MIFNVNNGRMQATVNTSRFDAQFKRAHKRLNMLVVSDSTPYVPFQQGQLRSQVRYPNGIDGDLIEWYAPYAHYQYYGTVYTDMAGRTWVEEGETKPINTGRPLIYSEPGTGARWFETAKQNHKSEWIREVRSIGGGGNA